jgi:hypothetical protein
MKSTSRIFTGQYTRKPPALREDVNLSVPPRNHFEETITYFALAESEGYQEKAVAIERGKYRTVETVIGTFHEFRKICDRFPISNFYQW